MSFAEELAYRAALALDNIQLYQQAQLIEDLLDVSRILRGKMALNVATVPLKATVEAALETVRLAAEAKNITIKTVFSPLQIQVQDNGQGINPNFLPHVFEYFRQQDSTKTRQFGGLGLGLAIVRHLCELHGGTVKVESPGEGLGTTFTVRLPVIESCCGQCATSECTEEARVDLKALRILVVDDDEDMRDLIQVILEPLGAKLLIVSSAMEALQVWEDFQPLMLICDIGMPSMDGYMLMHKIRQRPLEAGGQIPAIALTAYTGEFNQRRALAAGFQQHLSKPIEPEDLVKAIAQLLT